MIRVLVVATVSFITVSAALAQTAAPGASSPTVRTEPPLTGANSFTQAQAKGRIEKAGFKQVKNLKKDTTGVWTARATQNGKSVDVKLDFKGNVVAGN